MVDVRPCSDPKCPHTGFGQLRETLNTSVGRSLGVNHDGTRVAEERPKQRGPGPPSWRQKGCLSLVEGLSWASLAEGLLRSRSAPGFTDLTAAPSETRSR